MQQLFLGGQDFYIRTRIQGNISLIHVIQPVGNPDIKDQTYFSCGNKGTWPKINQNPRSAAIVARGSFSKRLFLFCAGGGVFVVVFL